MHGVHTSCDSKRRRRRLAARAHTSSSLSLVASFLPGPLGIPHGTVVYCGWSEGSRTGWGEESSGKGLVWGRRRRKDTVPKYNGEELGGEFREGPDRVPWTNRFKLA